MKICQDAKKRRKNISESYQNVFDDGEGTQKKRLQQDKADDLEGLSTFSTFLKIPQRKSTIFRLLELPGCSPSFPVQS